MSKVDVVHIPYNDGDWYTKILSEKIQVRVRASTTQIAAKSHDATFAP